MSGVNLSTPGSTIGSQPGIDPQIGKTDDPAKIRDAAQQFEALLLTQVLQSAHEGGGWLGTGEDSADSCASSFAEQQLAVTIARQGGLGLSDVIVKGLQRRQ
jgi:Rod binding domain-containing protein